MCDENLMGIKVGDKFILHSDNGADYKIEVVNINDFREPSMRYAVQAYDPYGEPCDRLCFIGDDFFTTHNWLRNE